MDQIAIPDDLWVEVEKQIDEIDAAKIGLNHFSDVIRRATGRLWDVVMAEMPELAPYHLRLDRPTKTIIKLRLKSSQKNA